MLTNVSFNLIDYIRQQVFYGKEEDEADREFEEYSDRVFNQTVPHVRSLEKRARKHARKLGQKA